MTSDSILLEPSEVAGSSTLSDAKSTKHQLRNGIKRLPSGAEDDSKMTSDSILLEPSEVAGSSTVTDAKAVKHQLINGTKSLPSGAVDSKMTSDSILLEPSEKETKHQLRNGIKRLPSGAEDDSKMTSNSILLEPTEVVGSSTVTDTKATKHQLRNGTKRLPSGAEDDSKKRGNSPLSETRPPKRQKNSGTKKYTSMAGNDSQSIAANELEFEIEKARFDIFNHFMNLKMQMDNEDKLMAKEMEIWTRIGVDNISGGKSQQNEFFTKSLIRNFEEVVRNMGQESKRDVDHTMDDIRKILVKLVNRIEQGFRQRPNLDAVKITKNNKLFKKILWIGLWILVAVLIGFFPDHLRKLFESVVAFYQSTILVIFLFCMLYCYNPSNI